MNDVATPTREWLETGRKWHQEQVAADRYGRTLEQFEEAITKEIEGLTWQEIPEDGILRGPMSPILMLKEVIEQLELRPIVGYTFGGCLEYPDGPETATYSLLGVEIKSSKQHFRLYFMDTGMSALSLLVDWYR